MPKASKHAKSIRTPKKPLRDDDLQIHILTELRVVSRLLGELLSHFRPASDDSKYAAEVENTLETYEELRELIYKDLKAQLG